MRRINLKFWKKKDNEASVDPFAGGGSNLGLNQPNLGLDNQDPGLAPQGKEGMPGSTPPPLDKSFDQFGGTGSQDAASFQPPQEQSFPQQASPKALQDNKKDFDLVLAKLDSIKSELDSIHQRLQRLEMVGFNKQPEAPQPLRRYAREY